MLGDRSRSVVLCPHAAETFKEWSGDRWAALAEALLADGFSVIASVGPRRHAMAWPAGVTEQAPDLVGLAASLAAAMLVVAVDSGPAHLADLAGTPVVGLFAATSPVTYGPYGSRALCVDRHREAFPVGRPYDTARHLHGNAMEAIAVPTVLARIGIALAKYP